jgi:hypothetical protein
MKLFNFTIVATCSIVMMMLMMMSAGVVLAADDGEREMTFKGQLVRVNPDDQNFLVRDHDRNEMRFSYNDRTEITGADWSVEGLAEGKGTNVTVQYKKEGPANIATKIKVDKDRAY